MTEPATNALASPEESKSNGLILRWLLFLAICLGLGYAALARYDPRQIPGLSDSIIYVRLVTGDQVLARDLRFRILVPYVAKPFYWLAKGQLGPEKSALFGLLIANSLFCATSASLLVSIGMRLVGDLAIAMLSATLYLLSFAIPNLQLAAMIDSGEACFLLAVTWSLLTNRWWLLPVWGLFGALAKETFVPLASVFTLAWWIIDGRQAGRGRLNVLWLISMSAVGLATVTIFHAVISGQTAWPWHTELLNPEMGYLARLRDSILSRSFWYVFYWLLPLGVWRLRHLPRTWVTASVFSAFTALALGAYKGVSGNVARPMFNTIGPLLSLSAALLITRYSTRMIPDDGEPKDTQR